VSGKVWVGRWDERTLERSEEGFGRASVAGDQESVPKYKLDVGSGEKEEKIGRTRK